MAIMMEVCGCKLVANDDLSYTILFPNGETDTFGTTVLLAGWQARRIFLADVDSYLDRQQPSHS
jgi:hypothetical protein